LYDPCQAGILAKVAPSRLSSEGRNNNSTGLQRLEDVVWEDITAPIFIFRLAFPLGRIPITASLSGREISHNLTTSKNSTGFAPRQVEDVITLLVLGQYVGCVSMHHNTTNVPLKSENFLFLLVFLTA